MRVTLDEYITWYQEHYGKKPSEKLIESFCRANGLPWPQEKGKGEGKDEEISDSQLVS